MNRMRKNAKKIVALMLTGLMCFGQMAGFAEISEEAEPLKAKDVMTKEVYVASDGTELPYRLYVPADYNPEKQYSFLLF